MWPQIAQAGLQLAGTMMKGERERKDQSAQWARGEAKVEADNVVRAAKNKTEAARGSMTRFLQSLNNARKLDASGRQQAAAVSASNIGRDMRTANTFAGRLEASEALGKLAADSAFRGVVGGSADMLSDVAGIRQDVQEELAARKGDITDYAMSVQAGEAAARGLQSQDLTTVIDRLDFGQGVNPVAPPQGGGAMSDILSNPQALMNMMKGVSELDSVRKFETPQWVTNNLPSMPSLPTWLGGTPQAVGIQNFGNVTEPRFSAASDYGMDFTTFDIEGQT